MTIETLHQLACGLHGHDTVLNFEPDRLSLRCMSCGYRTAGWTLADERSVPRTARARRTATLYRVARALASGHLIPDALTSRLNVAGW